ncbi:MAG: type II secretion system protein GspL [Rhodoferax sp.]|nr:type II secretion system protein GspL [Rhodoferax sp.]
MTPTPVLLPLPDAQRTAPVGHWLWGQDYRLGCSVVAVVPAQALSWHRVQLPSGALRPAARLRSVLEGLLEDQLLDEPSQLHFALPPGATTGQPLWVAACASAWLRDALQRLEQQGHTVQSIVPEFAPTDQAPQQLWLTTQTDQAWAMWCDAQGVHQRPLEEHLLSAETLPPNVHRLPVLAEPALAHWAAPLHLGEVALQPTAERLAQCIHSPWDLAQGEFSKRSPGLRRLAQGAATLWHAPQWRPARWAAFALVGAQLLGLNLAAWQAHNQLTTQRAALTRTLLDTFPATPVVVDAPLQMERAVAALRATQGGISARDLESQLLALASTRSFQTLEGSAPTSLEYVAGSLRLDGLGLGAEAVQTLQNELRPRGYSATQLAETLQLEVLRAP